MTTNKQKVFIAEYLKCFNATEAARRAGYAYPNVEGPKNLVKPSIKEQIDAELQARMMSADEALVRMAEIARGEWSEYIEAEPGKAARLNAHELIASGKSHLIKSIVPTREGTRYDFPDMQGALNTVLKHHGELVELHDHTTKGESLNENNTIRDQSLLAFAALVSTKLSSDDTGGEGAVDANEPPPVGSGNE